MIAIIAYGTPGPQGSKTRLAHGAMVESSKKVKPWREAVRSSAVLVRQTLGDTALERAPLDEPLYVRMVFTLVRPRGHYRTGKNAHLLRDGAPDRPSGPPDLSKLARSTEDALTDAGIWRDDSRLVEYVRLAKVYANEDPDALDAPGVKIEIMTRGEKR